MGDPLLTRIHGLDLYWDGIDVSFLEWITKYKKKQSW